MPYKHAADRRRYSREARARWRARQTGEALVKLRNVKRLWAQANKPHQRYKARVKRATVAPVDFDKLIESWDGLCGICRKPVEDTVGMHWDHIIPLSRGGEHRESNLQPTHPVCNLRKGSSLPSEIVE